MSQTKFVLNAIFAHFDGVIYVSEINAVLSRQNKKNKHLFYDMQLSHKNVTKFENFHN